MNLKLGFAQAEITPPIGGELCGFAKRVQPSARIIDPLFAKCLFLSDGYVHLMWITVDLIGIEHIFVRKLKMTISEDLNFPDLQILVSASHTHSGPGTVPLNFCGKYNPQYLENLLPILRKLSDKAYQDASPCRIMTGQVSVELGIDRRNLTDGFVDPILSCLTFTDENEVVKLLLVNYGMHPVCMWSNGISADYPGRLCKKMTHDLPDHPAVMFTLGACGNVNPPQVAVDEAQMELWSQILADRLIKTITVGNQSDPGPELFKIRTIDINNWWQILDDTAIKNQALESTNHPDWVQEFGSVFNQAVDRWKDQVMIKPGPLELNVIQLGAWFIITINAEIFAHIMPRIRKVFPQSFLVSCTNGHLGYLPHNEAFSEGGYEVETAPFFFGLPSPDKHISDRILHELSSSSF